MRNWAPATLLASHGYRHWLGPHPDESHIVEVYAVRTSHQGYPCFHELPRAKGQALMQDCDYHKTFPQIECKHTVCAAPFGSEHGEHEILFAPVLDKTVN